MRAASHAEVNIGHDTEDLPHAVVSVLRQYDQIHRASLRSSLHYVKTSAVAQFDEVNSGEIAQAPELVGYLSYQLRHDRSGAYITGAEEY
ncbi:unnamed protein product [Phytophthora lilii]|uniref:Unnamed protein product n=1 Tax=Phytophthora lilii TaxID=2077276 RepID=A0A9W7D8T3_9STRA|nr:unnamed protein product [Phytophthora lilii]